jgi:hypothetical protein
MAADSGDEQVSRPVADVWLEPAFDVPDVPVRRSDDRHPREFRDGSGDFWDTPEPPEPDLG